MFVRTERSVREFISFYPIVSIIIVLNILVWLLMYIIPIDYRYGLSLGDVLFAYGIGQNAAISNGEYWRLFTPIFMHAQGFAHVGFNSFSLILFGPALEQMVGKIKFIAAYLGAGLLANIGVYILDPSSSTLHLGASGAIYGLFGIYIFMTYFRKHLIDPASAGIVQAIFIFGLIMSFLQPRVNVAAHVCGFIGGLIIAAPILINAEAFSHVKNYMKRSKSRQTDDTDNRDASFNPNRWKRSNRLSAETSRKLKWILFFTILIAFLIMSYYA